ncbi:SRPBCC domain-containing protein [Streptomyces sp. NPDC057445]|uniref:SRPBCC domain-containing protein n=1 Tax=Streptomyces sp. NPDC057445 TaxID=3346136 RepID=UPI0036AEB852
MTSLDFDVYVRATPQEVWTALTDPAMVPRWRLGMTFETDWQAGSVLTTRSPDGEGSVQQAVPGQRLVYDWSQTGEPDLNGGRQSVVSFELEAMGEVTRLNVVHGGLDPDGEFLKIVKPGWPMLLSSLKSLVETGRPLAFPVGG